MVMRTKVLVFVGLFFVSMLGIASELVFKGGELVFKSGIRIEKALNLKVGDFQDNTDEFYSVKILEDNGKYETILVPKKLIKTDLDRIIKINDSEAYVFNAGKNPNKPLSLQTAYKIFKQIRLSI